MEDVLDLYEEPYDPLRPKVNLDEKSKQLVEDIRPTQPMKPGYPQRYDYEYKRNGTRPPQADSSSLSLSEAGGTWR